MAKKHEAYIKFKRQLLVKGVTYKEVAKIINTTEATVMCKINGTSDFYISEMRAICETLGIETDIFFADDVA